MKRYLNRRSVTIVGALLTSQLLSACIILPRPFLPHHRAVVVVPAPGHSHGGYRGGYEDDKYDRDDRHDRRGRGRR